MDLNFRINFKVKLNSEKFAKQWRNRTQRLDLVKSSFKLLALDLSTNQSDPSKATKPLERTKTEKSSLRISDLPGTNLPPNRRGAPFAKIGQDTSRKYCVSICPSVTSKNGFYFNHPLQHSPLLLLFCSQLA